MKCLARYTNCRPRDHKDASVTFSLSFVPMDRDTDSCSTDIGRPLLDRMVPCMVLHRSCTQACKVCNCTASVISSVIRSRLYCKEEAIPMVPSLRTPRTQANPHHPSSRAKKIRQIMQERSQFTSCMHASVTK